MLYSVDRSAVILKPTQLFLDWLNASIKKDGGKIELTLAQTQANCRVYLVLQQDSPEKIVAYIDENYLKLFELEVASWFEAPDYWPKMDLKTFSEFFEIEVLDEIIDLADDELMNHLID